ncbi:MAG: hypothetical protein WAV95_13395 [Azonexus sp.]
MTSCHLLLLEAGHLSAFILNKGELEAEAIFDANADDHGNFARYLAARRQGRFHLLTNLAEEAYVRECIPALWGGDRQMLIARKARQHFPEPALSCVRSLGREKTTRRNENLLISALTAPEQLQPWLPAIQAAGAALSGIYSPALLNGQLLEKLDRTAPHCLLLCLFGHSLRESYLHNGHTVFSRLIVISDTTPATIAHSFVTEASRLQQYLIAQRLIARDAQLAIFIIAHPQAVALIEKACGEAEHQAFSIIDSHSAARQLKLKTLPADSCSAPLFLHLLAHKQPREQFASPALRLDFRLAQGRRLIWGTALSMLALSGLSTVHALHQAGAEREESAQMAHAEQVLRQRQKAVVSSFPKLDLDPESLHQLLAQHAQLTTQRGQLVPSLLLLGGALDQVDEIEVDNLDWRIERIASGAGTPVARQVITLNGYLPGDSASPGSSARQAQASLEHFNDVLRATATCRAEIAKPLLTTNLPVPGDDRQEESASLVAHHFSLRISCQK